MRKQSLRKLEMEASPISDKCLNIFKLSLVNVTKSFPGK